MLSGVITSGGVSARILCPTHESEFAYSVRIHDFRTPGQVFHYDEQFHITYRPMIAKTIGLSDFVAEPM